MRVIEEAIVTSLSPNAATVLMSKGDSSACASCGLCAKSKDARVMTLDAAAFPQLAEGNRVQVEIDLPSPYLAVWLMFAQPLVLLVAGIFIGMKIGEALLGPGLRGLASIGCAVVLVAVNYVIVSWLDKHVFSIRGARARIVEIIS